MDIILGKLKESWEGSWQQVLRGESGEDVLREGRERNGREMHVWDIELKDNLEGVNEDGFDFSTLYYQLERETTNEKNGLNKQKH